MSARGVRGGGRECRRCEGEGDVSAGDVRGSET